MPDSLSRRDFLKAAGLLSMGFALPPSLRNTLTPAQDGNPQNVIILVFDAWSGANVSLYGYPRRTTPKLEKLADRAVVYHNHFAGGHFTTPGTASLLTGTTPWEHQIFYFNGEVREGMGHQNIFQAFPHHHRLAYTHNPLANILLDQFSAGIDRHLPWQSLYLNNDPLLSTLFKNDQDISLVGWDRAFNLLDDGFAYSKYLSRIYEYFKQKRAKELEPDFPRGVPNYGDINYFTIEDGLDWVSDQVSTGPQPFMGYFHFFPPHLPYNTRHDFYNRFAKDGYRPLEKPMHVLQKEIPKYRLTRQRQAYDEFILYVDSEFQRFYQALEDSGVLENTWLVLTTDHGEMFERGIIGHIVPVYHQPILQIPMVIFPPGQKERVDVYSQTSAIDLLPTLLQVTGQEIPSWSKGVVMPPFMPPGSHTDRDISLIHVEKRDKQGAVAQASAVIIRGRYKLMWIFGYENLGDRVEDIELFDIESDPEELHNLYPAEGQIAAELKGELEAKLRDLNPS